MDKLELDAHRAFTIREWQNAFGQIVSLNEGKTTGYIVLEFTATVVTEPNGDKKIHICMDDIGGTDNVTTALAMVAGVLDE